jgi:hypothetical protein
MATDHEIVMAGEPDTRMYGHRARIGYTSPPLTTEVFPYEFYKIVPEGVTHHQKTERTRSKKKTTVSGTTETKARKRRQEGSQARPRQPLRVYGSSRTAKHLF